MLVFGLWEVNMNFDFRYIKSELSKIKLPLKIKRNSSFNNPTYRRRRWTLGGIGILILLIIIISVASSSNDHPSEEVAAIPQATPKPAPNIPPASAENDLLEIATKPIKEGSKFCYLTFDDGPNTTITPGILDVLKEQNVSATFFMLGKYAQANPDIVKRVHQEGHLLANHGYSHNYDIIYENAEKFWEEVEKTHKTLTDISGEEPFKLFRFPGGGHNTGENGAKKQDYKKILQDKGFYFADWNALNGDTEGHSVHPEKLLNRIKETAKADNIVVLMHDATTKATTVEALPNIIQYLREQGYEFKRLDQVEYYDNTNAEKPGDMVM